ncbi:hypothetical protein K7887_22100 (plasmid) [Sutcliffiella horikoshii]|uniref:hypothetical protein n=1 Tax=Sutcliffiella horikoshii TaxID=79883 RepID=UPI001CBCD182|nr:hypothetical protein [Sutcliffiella horikoshii]UAL49814.1 hypothetical protein K7887_22100 [Sutcliffiella horikoshii]
MKLSKLAIVLLGFSYDLSKSTFKLARSNKYLAIRPQLKYLNRAINRATYEVDVALVEELMEEKRRLIESVN